MTNVPTLINVGPGGGDPLDQLQAQVRAAVAGTFDILGEMGRTKSGNVVYLARELSSGHLVAMKLSRGKADREFGLEVVRQLDETMPGLENQCPQCKAILADWGRFCTRCGADLGGAGVSPAASETIQLVDAVKQATAGVYEILGKMDRRDSKGAVFFARDLKRGKLVALRLQRDAAAAPGQAVYSLGETQVFQPMAAELGATQVESIFSSPTPPPAPPPVVTPAPQPPRPTRGVPTKAIAAGVGVVLIAIVAYFAFREPEPAVVPPPPAVAVAEPAPPPPAPEPPPPDPPATVADTPEQGTIEVAIRMPPGARITIDGRRARGSSISVPSGAHTVALAADGFEPVSARLTVDAGQTIRWRPKLVAVARDVAVANPPPPPPPPPAAAPASCVGAVGKNDWTLAADLCAKEANGGNVVAQRNYARLFDEGHGIPRDRVQAASWYTRAAAGGDRESQVRMGYMYRMGEGVKRDDRQSVHFFRLAAEGGSAGGQLEYGTALETGKGISKNEREAADWYRKAGAGGNTQALTRLGMLYERGKGVERNQTEAANLYREAATKGNGEAAYYLGKLYKDGKGVEKSMPQAIEWFRKAAQMGYPKAAEELRDLEPGE